MTLKDISFDLPPHLIADRPSERRGDDRLLVLSTKTGKRSHRHFSEITQILDRGTLCIVNNSKVRKSRLVLVDDRGKEVSVLFSHPHDAERKSWAVLLPRASRKKPGEMFQAPEGRVFTLKYRERELWIGSFSDPVDEVFFQQYGHVPLPPYMKREDRPDDETRYQTVYAEIPGSSAAPTAGLHFTPEILTKMQETGIEIAAVTLHVGLGTFLPIRTHDVTQHRMHTEEYEVPPSTALALNKALDEERPILAVGTTSLRTLESAVEAEGRFQPKRGNTDLFIHPGYAFRVTRFLLTNFHTPGSTLLLLVAALAGLKLVLDTYQEAIQKEYRFFSYGDAMLFDPR